MGGVVALDRIYMSCAVHYSVSRPYHDLASARPTNTLSLQVEGTELRGATTEQPMRTGGV